ncbi:MAG: acyl-CoA thioesterase [Burkholderiales bacterium]|nr:MAG: acyl-CoA thioesterase [Burkholderiales bacterium]
MKFSTAKQIRFHHCDPAGIVFYPQFFYLLHEAQEDFLAHIGFPEHEMIRSGFGVPIVDLQTQFMGMCRNGEQIRIDLTLWKLGNASLGMDYAIHGLANADNAAAASPTPRLKARSVVVYSRVPDGQPVRIPDALRAALAPYLEETPTENP